jgi:hypothetical protein
VEYKFKYTILSGIQVFFSAINLLLLTVISSEIELNHFLIALNLVGIIQQIINSPFEQFLYYFAKIFTENENYLNQQLGKALKISLLFSFSILIALVFGGSYLMISLFDVENVHVVMIHRNMLAMIGVVAFTTSITVIHSYFVSTQHIVRSYIIALLPIISQFFGMIYKLWTNSDLIEVAYFISFGYFIAFSYGIFCIYRTISLKNNSDLKLIYPVMLSSVKLRFAHNIHIVGTQVLINNYIVLQNISNGNFILLVKKFSDAVMSTINGPALKLMPEKIQYMLSSNLRKESFTFVNLMQNVLKAIWLQYLLLFLSLFILYFVNMKFHFKICSWYDYINILSFLFITIFVSLELPYSIILNALNKSQVFVVTNISYIVLIFLISEVFISFNLIVLFPISFLCGQILVYFLNKKMARVSLSYEFGKSW